MRAPAALTVRLTCCMFYVRVSTRVHKGEARVGGLLVGREGKGGGVERKDERE
jgi:hypothetical protein